MNWFLSLLDSYSYFFNLFFSITIVLMFCLYFIAIIAPYSKIAKVLPLTIMFNPKENIDLDLQSVGYALLHSTWLAQISHYTIFIDAFFWFVLLGSVHWGLSLLALLVMVYQGFRIGEKWFGISFIGVGLLFFVGSFWVVESLNTLAGASYTLFTSPAWLVAVFVLLLGGLIRFVGHFAEPAPPMLLDDSDQFVKITPKTANWKLLLMPIYGFVAEFSSGLPYRLFIVQVNYLYQRFAGVTPQHTQTWTSINERAKQAFEGGYTQDEQLGQYYKTVVND